MKIGREMEEPENRRTEECISKEVKDGGLRGENNGFYCCFSHWEII